MQNVPTTDKEIYPSPDFVRLALAAEITSPPGSEFAYNNKAVNLLAGVVEKASGQKMDEYLREGLFGSLGIEQFAWTHDKAGNPHGMSGLQILPADFAKLGQLVVQRGQWKGEQLIAPQWLDESMKAGQPYVPTCGLLWWLISDREERVVDDEFLERMRKAGVDGGFVEKIASIRGRYTLADYLAKLEQTFGPEWQAVYLKNLGSGLRPRTEVGSIVGYAARGYLGQYLLVFPEPKIVVVRMREASETSDERVDNFEQIDALSMALWRGPAKDGPTPAK
jgi:CubicO group peptidase (beta-lactamase class C family)